ncbi:LysR family transcriptional regulator [Georgenia sp. Z1344]|uniref:LysR family transcriptional regulator n=1 Tax=Georgenia sp. Z1344 TaxID=3416706 RepID=UPI003CF95024
MDARQLEYFLAVVDEGGVRAAAEKLYVAQPSVSQSIRTLERSLGTDLFSRAGRSLRLTAAGEALVAPAREVLHWLDLSRANVEAVSGLRRGRLVITTMPSQAVDPLPGVLDVFSRQYPHVEVVIRAAGTPAVVSALVLSGAVEVGIAATTTPLSAGSLTLVPVAQQGFIVVAPRDSRLPAGRTLSYADLEGIRLIAGQDGTGMRKVADEVVAANRSTAIVIESEHREAILPMVLAGTGTAIMAEGWRSLARHAGLQVNDLRTDVGLTLVAMHRSTELSPAASAFLDVFRSAGSL